MGMPTTVVGTGSWGTTLAIMLARKGQPVTLWARTEAEVARLVADGENRPYLPAVRFPEALRLTANLEESLRGCRLLILVVPAQRMRENVQLLREQVPADAVILSATKGMEIATTQRMSQVIAEELPPACHGRIAVLSGPNIAWEVAAGLPAASVVAAADEEVARFVQEMLMSSLFRVYTHDDVIGVELGGALKNIIALAAGAVDGFGYGDNAKAAIMVRGLAEMVRLGIAVGANPLTFAGLAGIGDLIATCSSRHSRNRYVGCELAKGRKLAAIQAGMVMVAEGITTTMAARQMAASHKIEMPVTETLYQVLFQDKDPCQAVSELMLRGAKHELDGLEQGLKLNF